MEPSGISVDNENIARKFGQKKNTVKYHSTHLKIAITLTMYQLKN